MKLKSLTQLVFKRIGKTNPNSNCISTVFQFAHSYFTINVVNEFTFNNQRYCKMLFEFILNLSICTFIINITTYPSIVVATICTHLYIFETKIKLWIYYNCDDIFEVRQVWTHSEIYRRNNVTIK